MLGGHGAVEGEQRACARVGGLASGGSTSNRRRVQRVDHLIDAVARRRRSQLVSTTTRRWASRAAVSSARRADASASVPAHSRIGPSGTRSGVRRSSQHHGTSSEESIAAAQRCLDAFLAKAGWTPTRAERIAGSLQYREYDLFTRRLMRLLMKKMGHPTDTSHGHDYTADAVEQLGRELAALAVASPSSR